MKMKNNLESSNKKKSIAAALVICFVGAIAMVGTYTFNRYKDDAKNELAQLEEENTKEKTQNTSVEQDMVINEPKTPIDEEVKVTEENPVAEQPIQNDTSSGTGKLSFQPQLNFNEDKLILWPVEGEVILNYSMDKTVYFKTLDQYKYNPALVISGAVGDQVLSVAKGLVKSIDVTAQTGTTVTVDLGNGFEAIYGQLKEVPVKVGDYVETKTVLGYLSEPTKYYSAEGCNLYFEMRKNGEPINPLEYLGE